MPREFTSNINTVSPDNIPGTSIGPVNPLEGLDSAAEAVDTALTGHILGGMEEDMASAETTDDAFLYDKYRNIQTQMIEEGKKGNEVAVRQYTAQLEKLKIAERQGALGPSAVDARRASLAKDYLTRFPHLADQIKKIYKTTGGSGGSGGTGKEQFKDPIEEGQQELLKAYAKTGGVIPLNEFIHMAAQSERAKFQDEQLKLRASLGQASELDLRAYSQARFALAQDEVQTTYRAAIAASQKLGAYNADETRATLAMKKNAAVQKLRMDLQAQIIAMRGNNMTGQPPTVSREFMDSQIRELEKIYDEAAKNVENLDQVKTTARWNNVQLQTGIINIGNFDDMAGFLARLSPEAGAKYLLENLWPTIEGNAANFMPQLAASAATPQAKAAVEAVRKNPKLGAAAFMNAIVRGEFGDMGGHPELADPTARAVVTNSVTQTALTNPNLSQENKDNVAVAAIRDEITSLGRGVPLKKWYAQGYLADQLVKNPEVGRIAMQEVASAAANIAVPIATEALGGRIKFELKTHGAKPWEAYPSGGPFSADMGGVSAMSQSFLSPSQKKVLDKLNDMYWITHKVKGEAEANRMAQDVLSDLQEKTAEVASAQEEEIIVKFEDLPDM
jgi:hypothetical protein